MAFPLRIASRGSSREGGLDFMYGANQFFLGRGNKSLLSSFPFDPIRIFPSSVRNYFHYFGGDRIDRS